MNPSDLALLLVDIQHDFWRPLQALPAFAALPANVRTLRRVAQANGLAVVHTQAVFQPDGADWMLFYRNHGRGPIPCVAGTPGVAFEAFAAPQQGEPVILKQTFDGFLGTDLEAVLHARHVKAVLVAGLVTSVCVLFTATAAYLRRFAPLVVADACADATDRHEATLSMYHSLCLHTVTTAQVENDLDAVTRLAGRFADTSLGA